MSDAGGFNEDIGAETDVEVIGTVKIGKTTFATNLDWQTVVGNPNSKKKVSPLSYAREQAPHLGADLVCSMNATSYGVGFTSYGHKRGMRPLASVLAAKLMDPFLAVFEVPLDEEGLKGWYLVACRSGTILPYCDRVIVDEEEAKRIFFTLNQQAAWTGQVIAPETWKVAQSVERVPITDFVKGNGTGIKLQAADNSASRLRFLTGICVVALIVGAGYSYHAWQGSKAMRLAKEQQDRTNQELERRKHLDLIRIANLPYMWDNKELGVYALVRCQSEILNLHSDIPGWKLTDLSCNPVTNVLTGHYTRTTGTMNWTKPALVMQEPHREITVVEGDDKGTKAVATWSMTPGTHTYTKHATTGQPQDDAYIYLKKQFDELRLPVVLVRKDVGKPLPPQKGRGRAGRNQPAEEATPWYYQEVQVQVKNSYEPSDFVNILAPLKVFLLDEVSVKIPDGADGKGNFPTWSFSGLTVNKIDIVQQASGHGPHGMRGGGRMMPPPGRPARGR